MSGRLLVLVLLAGCASPPFQEPGRGGLVLREELWHAFEYRAEVVDDPWRAIGTGGSTEPARILWAEDEQFLYAIDLDGEPSALRALFYIEARRRVDVDEAGRWRISEHGAREALRVDWSADRVGTSVAELGATDFEPVPWYFPPAEDPWGTGIARDPDTNELVSITTATRYIVRDGDLEEGGGEVTVLHVFERVED
ncbi:MAG: hypothetical protein M5U28_13415 [Sandaracinaceae bacterium]|nr:hypothetical protein [Sandaracinaceae bacterium]